MTATPAVVAQRMADLLQCFPSAAIGGVQWQTLVRKYEEKHGVALSLEKLGHSSALSAATALLWDSLRIVDKSDIDNPVVAIEDAVALTPCPSGLASWPSLYKALCDIACNHGEAESTSEADGNVILLSKIKPLLQRYWHSNFDELGLAYFTEEGSIVKLKKMKHLLHALLRWRTQRVEWRASMLASGFSTKAGCTTELDAALDVELLLVPSKKHNDLILCCVRSKSQCSPLAPVAAEMRNDVNSKPDCASERPALRLELPERQRWADISDTEEDAPVMESECLISNCKSQVNTPCSSEASHRTMEEELAFLRSENAKLRCQNQALEHRPFFNNPFLQADRCNMDRCNMQVPDMFEDFDLDDPSEPPPPAPKYRYYNHSPACSTSASLGFGSGFCSGSQTPFSESSLVPSGGASPMAQSADQIYKGASMPMMPVWFQIIPTGVVQEARAMFGGTNVPSWFVNGEAQGAP